MKDRVDSEVIGEPSRDFCGARRSTKTEIRIGCGHGAGVIERKDRIESTFLWPCPVIVQRSLLKAIC